MKYICNKCGIKCILERENKKIKLVPESCPFEERDDGSNWQPDQKEDNDEG